MHKEGRMRKVLAASLALGLAGLAGCTAHQNAEVREDVRGIRQEIDQAADSARQKAAETALAGKVKTALETRKGMDPRGINVDAQGSTIVLKGDVSSPEQARLAEQVANEVEGVSAVRNELTMRVPATAPTPAPTPEPSSSGR